MTEAATSMRMRKSLQALASSHVLFQAGDTEGACNRAYYAMFHAAHAALDVAGVIAPGAIFKTHNGLIAVFSKELVLSERVPQDLGRSLSKVYDMRLLADYSGEPPDLPNAKWACEQAEGFVTAIRKQFFA